MKFKAGDKIIPVNAPNTGMERTVVGYASNGHVVYEYDNAGVSVGNAPEDKFKHRPTKKEGWINIYEANKNPESFSRTWTNGIFDSKESAMKVGQTQRDYITTIKIEWEE